MKSITLDLKRCSNYLNDILIESFIQETFPVIFRLCASLLVLFCKRTTTQRISVYYFVIVH